MPSIRSFNLVDGKNDQNASHMHFQRYPPITFYRKRDIPSRIISQYAKVQGCGQPYSNKWLKLMREEYIRLLSWCDDVFAERVHASLMRL